MNIDSDINAGNQKISFKRKRGFMLVELSIAIVVIGLLFAGVSGGVALIEKAKLQSDLTKINNIVNGATMFSSSYGSLPGVLKDTSRHFESAITDGSVGGSVAAWTCTRGTVADAPAADGEGGLVSGLRSKAFKSGPTASAAVVKVDSGMPSLASIAMCQLYASKTSDITALPGKVIAGGTNAPNLKIAAEVALFYSHTAISREYFIVIGDASSSTYTGTVATVEGGYSGKMAQKLDVKLSTGDATTGNFLSAGSFDESATGTPGKCSYSGGDASKKTCMSLYRLEV